MPYYAMSGAREFTDYRPAQELNAVLMNKYNIKNNHEYRRYMQANGNKVLEDLRKQKSGELCTECPVCGRT